MSEETRELVPVEDSVPSPSEAPGVPVLSAAEDLAMQVIQVMDKIAETMELESPHPSTARRVRGSRTVPRQFIVDLIAAVESMPEFRGLGTFDPAEAREVLEAGDTQRQVAERTARFLASINYTIESRWAKIVEDAITTFTIASIRAKNPNEAKLAARVASLKKSLGRKGGRKKREGTKEE